MPAKNLAGVRLISTTQKIEAKILVVDDDPDFLALLQSEINRIPGVEVTVAHSPAEAIRHLTEHTFNLVVSDWALSSTTAPEVFSKADLVMGKARHKVPVLFISGSEKVGPTQRLNKLRHFEPVSFMLKRCGPPLISRLAEHILTRFPPAGGLQPC